MVLIGADTIGACLGRRDQLVQGPVVVLADALGIR